MGVGEHGGIDRRGLLKCGLYAPLAAGLSSGLFVGGCGTKRQERKPNIFLITADTLRADHLGCYGYGKDTSPNIDRFADESLLFENCLSQAPDTRSSFASILTGFYPHETQITSSLELHDGVKTLAEMLGKQGYKTAAVVSNYVLRYGMGYEQGFDVYDDSLEKGKDERVWPERIAEHTTQRAIELLERFQDDPLFMWVHYQDPHGPYTPPEGFAERFHDPVQPPRELQVHAWSAAPLAGYSGRGGLPAYQYLDTNDYYFYLSRYDGEINYLDRHFQHLLDALKEGNHYDRSLIIFSSDHGEGLGEHDYFFAHGEYLYHHQLHVPLIVRYGDELSGRRSDGVEHLDIVPTIRNFLGMEADGRLRGADLGTVGGAKKAVFSEMKSRLVTDGIKFCLTYDKLKLIYTPLTQQFEVYDLAVDAGETANIIDDAAYQGRIGDLSGRLERLQSEDLLGLGMTDNPRQISEEEKEKLRSLGYVE